MERRDNLALEKLRASISHSMTSEKKKKKIISRILTTCLSYIKTNKETDKYKVMQFRQDTAQKKGDIEGKGNGASLQTKNATLNQESWFLHSCFNWHTKG